MTKGVGGENNFVFDDMSNLHAFLSMTEDRKAICDMQYQLNKDSNISKDLFGMWTPPLPEATRMTTTYITNNNYSSCYRTWTDKYTTVLFDEQTPTKFQWKQPIPHYVRWYLTDGKQHYMTFEERRLLPTGAWDDIEEIFYPPKF